MEKFVSLALGVTCLLTPITFILLVGGVYALGVGALKLPGVSRREIHPGQDWTTVSDLSRKAGETIAAIISLAGTLFGLIGFLLPWVGLNVGAAASLLDFGNLNGTLSGIALAFQSFVAGITLLSTDIEVQGATALAVALLLISVMVSLIPLALVLSAAMGIGLISVPLGLLKVKIQRLARGLLIMTVLSLCLTCTFFAGVQATVGGVKIGGGIGDSSSFSIGAEVANGFWITVGGLVLALVGAVVANTLAEKLADWAKRLTMLERDKESNEVRIIDKSEDDVPPTS